MIKQMCVLLGFVPVLLHAQDLVLTDKEGNVVENAVVSLLDLEAKTPDAIEIMDQKHKQFVPHLLVVQKGQKVAFPNSDDIRHHVYSFSPIKPFEIRLYQGEQPPPPVEFDESGLVVLGCNIHDDMIGYIYVADNHPAMLTNDKGVVSIPGSYRGRLGVWHELLESGDLEMKAYGDDWKQGSALSINLLPSFEDDL
ncbi:methylamine utilization protein [Marinomonas mediterranea]|uniref:Methylamine utilization protein n=1 Tax=Marinomonas mediterranea (strain ATCC 700492 / JCM 21426 / NBRC 103028 / MMB-1) TaxID=717774 RepID=F2JVS3_MARM1|nr:methylamine utilization protein [Marinomonas mediterranea]ADZ91709.1 hypothetical protein Marme_2477 [Marinomonas mediterranea MMB-1]WCN09666.1 methylamine utilization protein [Marinomonas mediterranea]WCN17805.1 methylamine utilization protein [Marinomonas mediterranea MMB-1]